MNVPLGISWQHPPDDDLPAVLIMAAGPDYMSACVAGATGLEDAEAAITGLAPCGRWLRSHDPDFVLGHPNPSACERFDGRRHWLFERAAAPSDTSLQEETPSTSPDA